MAQPDNRTKTQLLAMSYSKVACYQECQYKAWLTYITKKITFTDTPFTIDGTKKHKNLEEHIRDDKPLIYKEYTPTVDKIKKLNAEIKYCEKDLAINVNLEPCEYFDKNTWLRATLDLLLIKGDKAIVIDYKSGKKKSGLGLQLRISAFLVFLNYPEITKVTTTFSWLQTNEFESKVYTRDDLPYFQQELQKIYEEMELSLETGTWQPHPVQYKCKWCSCKELCEFKV